MAHLLLDGSGDYAVTSDAAVLDVAGDIDLRCRAQLPDWSNGNPQAFIAKNAVGSGAYIFRVTATGFLELWWSADTTTFTNRLSTAVLPFADNARGWVRATLDVDNGAGGYDLNFHYSADDVADSTAVSWTQLGATITGGTTTSIGNATADLFIGRDRVAGSWLLTGDVYRAQVYDGIDGTPVFDGDPSDTSTWDCPDKLFFTDKANSATVTLQGDAALIGDCPSSGNRMGGTGAIRKPPR